MTDCKDCKHLKKERIKGTDYWFCHSPKIKSRELLIENDLIREQDTCINF